MKKTLLALAALSAYAGIAQADESASALSGSSVTLYGVFDASIHYISDVQWRRTKERTGAEASRCTACPALVCNRPALGCRLWKSRTTIWPRWLCWKVE